MPRGIHSFLLTLAVLVFVLPGSVKAEDEDYVTENLIPNGDLELDADGDGYPDGWPRAQNATPRTENGNRYLSLTPYGGLNFNIPLDPDWAWVHVSCRMRCHGITLGPHPDGYQDARMVMSWNDKDNEHIDPWPNVLRGLGTFEWKHMERTFNIPPGAAFLSIGAVNYAAEGTVDYDDVVIRGKRRPPLRDLPLPKGAEAVWNMEKAWRLKSSAQEEVCLNGLWQFRLAPEPEKDEESVLDYLGAPPQGPGWGHFKVPGSWRGDRSLQVRLPEALTDTDMNGINAAWYRREIQVPADWADRRIQLRFDLVQTRADVFVDGKAAGTVLWPGGTVDVTKLCRPGRRHRLEVLVLALPLDTRTQVFMGPDRVFETEATLTYRGLCGDVFLRSSPSDGRIESIFVQPSVEDQRIALDTTLALPPGDAFRLRARVEHEGRTVKEFASGLFSADDLRDGHFVFSSPWADPPLWDIHDRKFCTLHLALTDAAGNVLDEGLPLRFAFRDFVIKGRDFYLNGKRIHLRAVNLGSATNADAGSFDGASNTYRRMKEYGFNFFIMNNYDFQAGGVNYFLDMIRAADEEGMLLSFSLPHVKDFGWNLEPEQRRAGYEALTRWCVEQVRHHPSVVLYAMNHNSTGYMGDQDPALLDGLHGPEAHNRRQALIAQEIAESLDPTRPVYHHQSGNLGSFITLNCYLNWAPIRERSRWLAVWAEKGVKPFFFVEWGLPHIASWSSYRGPQFIWRANVMQQAWTHEFAATFKGDDAYEVEQSDIECLKSELRFWENDQPFHYWNLHPHFSNRERNVLEIKSLYASKNWPAHRTWGMSAMLPWDQGDFWRHKEGAPSEQMPLETDWENARRPGVSPDYAIGGGSYLYSRYPEKDWEPSCLGRTFLRYNMPLLAYLGGKADDFTEEGHNFLPGEIVRKQVIAINDTREPIRCSYGWTMQGGPTGKGDMEVAPGGIGKRPLTFALPLGLEPGAYKLSLSVTFANGATQEDEMDIHVMAPVENGLAADRVALYDPVGKTREALSDLGIGFKEVGSAEDLSGYDLLIVGREALSVEGVTPDISALADGLNVLVFEQAEDVLHKRLGFRTQVYGLRRAFPRVPDHPILDGVSVEHLRDWRGDATLYPPYMKDPGGHNSYPHVQWCGFSNSRVWRCGTGGNVATALIEKPARGDFLPIVDGGFDLQYAPILEHRQGKGCIIFCQMDVTGRTEQDPVARRLIRNLVGYGTSATSPETGKVYYAGAAEGREALTTLGITARSPAGKSLGEGDLLVLGPGSPFPAEVGAEVQGGVNVLFLANEQEKLGREQVRCEVKTVVNSPLSFPIGEAAFRGLSNAELHFRNFKELPVLRQLPTADREGLLAAIGPNAGKLVFCQVAPWMFDPDEFPHDRMTYRRTGFMLSRILANLGARMENRLVSYWNEPALMLPDLTASWKGKADPDDAGIQQGRQTPEFDDSDWEPINVPGTWESQRPDLADYTGIFWYRTTFDLPAPPDDVELWLVIGAVDDEDWTYLNGQLIGSITAETHPDDYWAAERRYLIPPELLKPTGNVLAVRVNDLRLSGGITRGPVTINAPGRWEGSYYIDKAEAGDDPYRYYRW